MSRRRLLAGTALVAAGIALGLRSELWMDAAGLVALLAGACVLVRPLVQAQVR